MLALLLLLYLLTHTQPLRSPVSVEGLISNADDLFEYAELTASREAKGTQMPLSTLAIRTDVSRRNYGLRTTVRPACFKTIAIPFIKQ